MDKFLLKLLDLFKWLYRPLNVDYAKLRAIVATKLIMDNRRQLVAYGRRIRKDPSNAFATTLFLYALFGAFVALAMYTIPSFVLSMMVFFSYIMVMVSMTLITDFSSILLDTSDNTIILPRPVDSRTLLAARLTHILLYLSQLALGLALIPSIVVLIRYGSLLFVAFWMTIGLSILTSVILTNAFYLLIMQFSTEEKLKSIINYFQIAMAIFIMAGYQTLPRMIERLDIPTFAFEISWWSFLLPPVWMAGTMEALQSNLTDIGHIALAMTALIFPPLGIYIVNKYLAPVFTKKIGSLGGDQSQHQKQRAKGGVTPEVISRWVASTPAEQGSFEVIYKMLGRDRKIKLKIYPAFGYVAVFGLIFMMRSKEDLATTWSNLPHTQYHLILLYLTFMVLQVALHEIPYTDEFRASWIYYSSPLRNPGEVLSGALKAICVRLFLPGYIVITTFVLAVWGLKVIDDVVVAMLNNILMLVILAMINKRYLPLSMAPDVRAQSGNLMRSILTFVLIGALGLTHFLLTLLAEKSLFLMALVPVQGTALYFISRAYKRTGWNQITL